MEAFNNSKGFLSVIFVACITAFEKLKFCEAGKNVEENVFR